MTINGDNLFQHAQLAEAAYADFSNPTVSVTQALVNVGFSQSQAGQLVKDWQVVSHRPNQLSGFSATVFQNKHTGEYVFAARGTEPMAGSTTTRDLEADIGDLVANGLAWEQIISMYNYWQEITTFNGDNYQMAIFDEVSRDFAEKQIAAGKTNFILEFGTAWQIKFIPAAGHGVIPLASRVDVTGHSLGGHLATAFSRLFDAIADETVTINGAGYSVLGVGTNITRLFATLKGGAGFTVTDILNVFGDAGPEVTAMDFYRGLTQPGDHQPIYIEDSAGHTLGHSADQMTDSLAVYDLFLRIDASLRQGGAAAALDTLDKIMKAAVSENAGFLGLGQRKSTFETLVDALGKILVQVYDPLIKPGVRLLDDREQFYKRVIDIRDDIGSNLDIESLVGTAISDVIASAHAADGIAWRYALKELNPFALEGNDSLYDRFNTKGELDLLDLESNKGTLSKEWIEDRAAMLSWVNLLNTKDIETQASNPYSKDGAENIYFEDMASGEKIYLGTIRGTSEFRRHFIFGSDEGDAELKGAIKDDRLYGMGGDDRLNGKGGNDHLEGGIGRDTYVFQGFVDSRDGVDTIVDRDGGFIYRGLDSLARGIGVTGNPNQWKSADGSTLYIKDGKNLVIKFGNGDQITIKHFDFAAALTADLPTSARHESFGIELAPPEKVALVEGTDRKHNTARGDIPAVTTALAEGGTKMFTVHVSDASNQDRTLKISLSGIDLSKFALSTGVAQYSFSGGSVTLTLAAGETSFTFALVNTGDTDQNGQLNLTAKVMETGKDTIDSNIARIAYTAVVETDKKPIRNVTDDDRSSRAFNLGVDSDTGLPADQPGYYEHAKFDMNGGNDLILRGTSNDIVYAGDGNDYVSNIHGSGNVQNGEQLVYAGKGDDWIDNGGGGGKLYGEDGKDIIGQITWDAEADPFLLPDGGWRADWSNWDVIWHSVGAAFHHQGITGATRKGNVIDFAGSNWLGKDGNMVLTADPSFQPAEGNLISGDFHSVDGYHYYYTFESRGGVNGILKLDWKEGDKDKHAEFNISRYEPELPTTPGKTLMDGGEGDDLIVGAPGTNTLVGGAGNDLIQGSNGVDRAYGDGGPESNLSQAGYGNDQIALGGGNDYADGGDGHDIIVGEDGADSLFGGLGKDYMVAGKLAGTGDDTGNGDYLDGEGGDDTLFGSTNNDTLLGGDDNDHLQGEQNSTGRGDDYLDGGDGNDTLLGMGGNDVLYGGAGADTLKGHSVALTGDTPGDDELYGEEGNDKLYGQGGNDLLAGGADDDQLDGGAGEDRLDGGTGNDVLVGQEGDDLLAGGQGRDQLLGGLGDDIYQLELGDSLISQADTIEDNEGENTLRFGGGIRVEDIVITASGALATIKYSAGDAVAVQNGLGGAIAWVEFADGSRHSIAELVGNSTTPLTGTDRNGNSVHFGGKGNDKLTSSAGRATISGGKGSDVLIGSGGNNTYLYSIGDGSDLLFENNAAPNRIRFGDGIRADDVRIRYNENVLTLQIGDRVFDSIRIQGFDPAKALENAPIDFYEFADGTVLTHAELLEQGFDFNGTAGNDDLSGTSVNDRLNGGVGNDVLRGGAGDDVYYFNAGSGRDTVVDVQGANRVVFGAGLKAQGLKVSQRTDATGRYLDLTFATGERLSVQNGELGGVQFFEFADGSWLSAEDLLRRLPRIDMYGTAGDDTLTAYDGNDTLLGFGGEDALSGGAGNDVLDGGQGDDTLRGGTGQDTYAFARLGGQDMLVEAGAQTNTIKLGADLTLGMVRWRQAGNNLVLFLSGSDDKMTLKDYFSAGGAKHWRIVAPSGQALSAASLIQRPDPYGNNKILGLMDEFKQDAWQNLLERNQEDGFIYQGGGKFYRLLDGGSVRVVVDKQSMLVTQTWVDEEGQTIYLGSMKTRYYSKDPDFDSSLVIKQEDFHQYKKQTLRSNASEIVVRGAYSGSVETDKVLVTTSYASDTSEGGRWEGSDYTERYLQYEKIVDINYNVPQNLGGQWYGYDSLRTSWAVLNAQKSEYNASYLTELTAGNGNNRIHVETLALVDGGAGNDTIDGGGFLYGNTGNDTISGSGTLAGGDGNDRLTGGGSFIGGKGNDVMMGLGGDNRYIVLDKNEVGVKLIVDSGADLNDYASWYFEKQLGHSNWPGGNLDKWVLDHTDFGDYVFGSYKDFLAFWNNLPSDHWFKEEYTIARLKANGILREPLPPILANDHRKIESLIKQGAIAADVIELPTGVTRKDLSFAWGKATHEGVQRTTLNVSWSAELRMQIVMPTANDVLGFGIEQFKLADGSILTMREAIAGLSSMPGSRVAYGSSSEDTMTGTTGEDLIYGLGADDRLSGGNGAHSLRGGSGNDRLEGGAGDDVLTGGVGKDEMLGGAGQDSLTGGRGGDRLKGGIGDDTYFLRRGDGHDTILDRDKTAGNTDTASFAANIRSDQLWFRKVDDDLEVRVIGTGDRFTIRSWYDGPKYHVEQFRTADGQVLLDKQVDALVQAMAGFAPPAAGQTTLPKAYQDALGGVIAANWQ